MLPRSGKALAVADGQGRNGVWLAEQGLDVLSIDFSPSAQRKAEALAMERGVTIAFVRADVHTWDYRKRPSTVVVEISRSSARLSTGLRNGRDAKGAQARRAP